MPPTVGEENRKKILIVEGDQFITTLLIQGIEKEGFAAHSLIDPATALAAVTSEKPDLIMVGLPLVGKLTTASLVKNIRAVPTAQKTPLIVLSGTEEQKEIDAVLGAGADDYLIKAYAEPAEIIGKMKKWLVEGWDKSRKPISLDSSVMFQESKKIKARLEKNLVGARSELSIISLVDDLVKYSFLIRASDIHIDPAEDKIVVRLRVDGVLHDAFIFPKNIQSEVITRIKVLSGMRTDEHQMAQDGRFKIQMREVGFIDIRVSIAPTYYGENCVMRILSGSNQTISLENLGFTPEHLEIVQRAMKKPYGMILVCGPTGSGKTTTLYAVLRKLNTKEVSIITVEDPVEYSLEGVDQIQVNAKTGLTFAHGLRFILRQDPNIIMVGEIRDDETANIAVNAAMTGHTLLSTLHANDAATALPRLIDMKVEPFLITSTINIIVAQRLVRMVCDDCKEKREMTEAEAENLKKLVRPEILKGKKHLYSGKGCEKCGMSGYKSRIGIHEILEMSTAVRELTMKNANADEIKAEAIKNGMYTMLEDGIIKALSGVTTIEEVLRVFHE